jgi:hypothetical protein
VNHQQSRYGLGKIFWRTLTLNAEFYAQAPEIPKIKRTALILVVIAAFSHAIGSGILLLIYNSSLWWQLLAFLVNGLSIVAGYYVWAWTIWEMGGWLRSPIPSYKKLLTLIGLTYSPQVFNFFTVVPLLGRPIEIGLALWSLVAAIVALHGGLNIKLGKAVAICSIGWIMVQIAIGVIQLLVQGFLD